MTFLDLILCESYQTVKRGGYFCIIRQPGNVLIFDRLTERGALDTLQMLAWEHGWTEGKECEIDEQNGQSREANKSQPNVSNNIGPWKTLFQA